MNKAILILAILAFSLAPTALSSPMKGSEDKDRELISFNLGTLLGGLFGGTRNTTNTTAPANNTTSNNSTATFPATNNTNNTGSNNNTATTPVTNNTSNAPVTNNTSSNNSTATIPAANNTNSSNNTSNIPTTNNTSSNNNTATIPVTNNTNTTTPPTTNNTNTTIPPVNNNTNTTTPPATNNTNTTTPVTTPTPTPIKYAKNDVYMPNFPTDCLRVHNEQRKKVGLGNLTWSDSLAASAQAWANNMAVNGFRHSGKPGENIASTSYSTYTLGRLLGMWVHEQDHYIVGCKYPKCSTTSAEVGHYTQMVWHSTTQVGCGFAPGANRGYNYLCCQYYRAGNIVGQYVY